MKKSNKISRISSPEELNKHLQSTSFFTWIALGTVIFCVIGLFVWAFVYKIKYVIANVATINHGEVNLVLNKEDLSSLKVGQKVYIENIEGSILSIKEDGYPVISNFSLDDGSYDYYIVIKEMRPIDYFTNK